MCAGLPPVFVLSFWFGPSFFFLLLQRFLFLFLSLTLYLGLLCVCVCVCASVHTFTCLLSLSSTSHDSRIKVRATKEKQEKKREPARTLKKEAYGTEWEVSSCRQRQLWKKCKDTSRHNSSSHVFLFFFFRGRLAVLISLRSWKREIVATNSPLPRNFS